MSVATIENNTPATISPFSIRNQWEIEWAEDNPSWKGIQKGRGMLTERGYIALSAIGNIGFCTSLQLSSLLKNNLREGRKAAKKLVRLGFLNQHKLFGRTLGQPYNIEFYSLGPLCKDIIKNYTRLKERPSAHTVLEKLSIFQLYTRFKEKYEVYIHTDGDEKNKKTEFVFSNTPIQVVCYKERLENYLPKLKRLDKESRHIIILEELYSIEEYLDSLPGINNMRFTTDLLLTTKPIQDALLSYKNGRLLH